MDREGIDIAVIFATTATSWCGLSDPELEAALCRAYNRWLVDYCAAYPERLKAVGVIPMADVQRGVTELRRCAAEPNVVGMMSFMSLDDKLADHPDFYPLYEEAQDAELPICLHGGADRPPYAPGEPMQQSWATSNLTSKRPAQHASDGAMIGGGIFDRFPKLRAAFLEAAVGGFPGDGTYGRVYRSV